MIHLTMSSLTGAGYAAHAQHSSRTMVPVQPSSYLYAHFRHVSGVPAPDGIQGAAVTRLKLLDSLIERLQRESLKAAVKPLPYTAKPKIEPGSFIDLAA